MSCILYHSKYCPICKDYLQLLSKTNLQNDIHFICIDKRVQENNKTYIVLDSGQKIILPDTITKVPALLLLKQGYHVLYGDQILQHLKPMQKQEVRQATHHNMEPTAFSFGSGGGFGDVVSDQYSFLDQHPDELKADGQGGMRQMHNYMDLNAVQSFSAVPSSSGEHDTTIRGAKKMGEDMANQEMDARMKAMQEQRDADMRAITGNKPPIGYWSQHLLPLLRSASNKKKDIIIIIIHRFILRIE